jgi:small subunit ribosomal protein S16
MAVRIRMSRMGRRHRPFFRINVMDSRTPRDGRVVEKLGHYDPVEKDKEKQIVLDLERVKYWLDNGAIPSDSVSEMLLRLGIKHKYAEEKQVRMAKARSQARARGRFFNKAEKIAAEKAAAKVAAEAEAKAKAEEEAKKKAEAEAKAKAAAEEPK